jgi:hypothetical protein
MAKQNKKQIATSTPDIYHGIPNTVQRQNVYLVEDNAFHFSLHNNKAALEALQSFNALIKDSIFKQWAGFSAFCEESKNTISCYHSNLFNAEPPKDQDHIITAVYVWNKILSVATADLTTQVPVTASGRKSTIGNCQYRAGSETGDGQLKTPQARACLKLFREILNSDKATVEGEDRYITEADLRQYIIDHAAELHTKQDPWRIFQYYRPNLISEKLITRK